jgi:type VI secretion system secreted protein VgrG
MPTFTQESRLLELTTPLGADKLLIRSIDGMEGISQLYSFRVECFAPNDTVVDFSTLVGQPICVRATLDADPAVPKRFFHGVVQTITRGARGIHNTTYSLHAVPRLWLLSRTTRSRIFQQTSVPDILKKVLVGFPVAYELQGTFEPRDYCTQYRESDLDFACRLMEEEGIFYYFKHELDKHTLIVANTPSAHKDLPFGSTMFFDPDTGGYEEDEIGIYSWEKTQTLRSGKTTLWDHSFELPHKNLEAQELIVETLQIGTISHKLKVGGNDNFELYDYPGGYAERFDGIAPGGGEQASNLQKIYEDNKRTVKIRMQQEAVNSVVITGYTSFLGVTPGYKFTLQQHFEDNDTYTITRCHFTIPQLGGYAGEEDLDQPPPEVVFNCIPHALPYRPQQVTAKPVIHGTQTAVVVGPSGEEIFTDKYGRVKVQFLWDREGQFNANSSCWVRCAFPWAGKNFGFLSIPRIGHEVVVAFEEGDPDQPVVVGSVYNPDMMPPYALPDNKTRSVFKSRSSVGGGGFNELYFEDKKDAEMIFFHAQKDMDVRVLNDRKEWIGQDTHLIVKRDQVEAIERDVQRKVTQDVVEEIGRDHIFVIKGKQGIEVTGSATQKVTGNVAIENKANYSMENTGTTYIKGNGAIVIESSAQISLKVGGNFVDIGPSGVTIKGTMVLINSGGAAGSGSKGSLNAVKAPAAALEAGNSTAGGHKEYTGGAAAGAGAAQTGTMPGAAYTRTSAGRQSETTHNPASPENETKTHWVAIRLKDKTGKPMAGQAYKVVLPGGGIVEGTLDDKGEAKVENIDGGQCDVSFPGLADWKKS